MDTKRVLHFAATWWRTFFSVLVPTAHDSLFFFRENRRFTKRPNGARDVQTAGVDEHE